jgi:hypothetical protein
MPFELFEVGLLGIPHLSRWVREVRIVVNEGEIPNDHSDNIKHYGDIQALFG